MLHRSCGVCLIVGGVLVVLGGETQAQALYNTSAPVRPAYQFPGGPREGGVPMGDSGLYATPYGGVSLGYDDNLFSSNQFKKGSQTEVYIAGAKLDGRDERSVIQLDVQAKYGRFADSTADNYSDPYFRGTYDLAFDERNFLRLGYGYLRQHDARGSTDRPPTNSSPDKFYDNVPGIVYAYGAKDAPGRVELYAINTVRRYLNNRESTIASDRDMTDYGGRFYWRAMPNTSLVLDARETDIKYKLSSSKLSSDETRIGVGVMWEATAATTGVIKVGRQQKRFNSDLKDYSGNYWEGDINWKPLSYSSVTLTSSRLPQESTGLGSFILSDATNLNWTHGWSDIFSTDVFGGFTKSRYQQDPRVDDISSAGFRASYMMRKWLTLGAEYTYTKRDSNQNVNDYTREAYFFFARMTM